MLISAAEYKILSEYSESQNNGQAPDMLPAITPELMKSRRTHSLQLAIGEILHNIFEHLWKLLGPTRIQNAWAAPF